LDQELSGRGGNSVYGSRRRSAQGRLIRHMTIDHAKPSRQAAVVIPLITCASQFGARFAVPVFRPRGQRVRCRTRSVEAQRRRHSGPVTYTQSADGIGTRHHNLRPGLAPAPRLQGR
jgi:hypothetical protein